MLPRVASRSLGLRQFLAAVLAAHLLAIVALAVCPTLHDWLHPDAKGDDGHACAVTLFLHGSGGDAPTLNDATALPAPCFAESTARLAAPAPVWVASVFALARVLEHAPPSAG